MATSGTVYMVVRHRARLVFIFKPNHLILTVVHNQVTFSRLRPVTALVQRAAVVPPPGDPRFRMPGGLAEERHVAALADRRVG